MAVIGASILNNSLSLFVAINACVSVPARNSMIFAINNNRNSGIASV